MPKYYVAGIPFDGENCLKHYGVKGMKWDQHIFGPDANTKYINWLKDAGQNIGKFANKAASTVSSAAGTAAKAVGGALNKGANFVTGNQARQNVNTANANVANTQSGRSKVNNAYARYDQLRNSETQHRTNANGWRESLANRAPAENFGRNQDRINANNEDRLANRDANRAEIAKMKADRMSERQRNAETQARAETQNAQQAYDRTLPGAAQKAATGAKGFLNSAGKWVSTAANNVGQTVGNAANQAGNAIDEVYRNSGASGLVDDISNRLTGNIDRNTAEYLRQLADHQEDPNAAYYSPMPQYSPENLRKEAEEYQQRADNSLFSRIGNAANAVGNWVGNAAQDVGNAANQAWNGVSDAASKAGNWIGDRAQDVGNAVGTAANNAWNGVSDAASKAGNWIGDRAQDVADWYTGGNHGENAERLDKTVRAYENEGDRLIDQGVDKISESIYMDTPGMVFRNENKGNPDSSAYASSLRDKRNVLFNEGIDDRSRGYQMHDIARSLGNRADAEQAQYDAAPRQRLTAAANAVGDAAGAVRDWVGGAASDVRDWVGDRASDVRNSVSDASQSVSDWYTGNPQLSEANWRQGRADDYSTNWLNQGYGLIDYYNRNAQAARDAGDARAAEEWQKAYENAIDSYRREQELADQAMDKYNNAPRQRIKGLFHSELDNRPDGVSDAFWKQYVFDGGTREQYERDWR